MTEQSTAAQPGGSATQQTDQGGPGGISLAAALGGTLLGDAIAAARLTDAHLSTTSKNVVS